MMFEMLEPLYGILIGIGGILAGIYFYLKPKIPYIVKYTKDLWYKLEDGKITLEEVVSIVTGIYSDYFNVSGKGVAIRVCNQLIKDFNIKRDELMFRE
ncbi:MAG: hypothetical protein QXR84_09480 [Candidatus Bathyarchaeia archaeon]